jgi:Uma2 family endonuclease
MNIALRLTFDEYMRMIADGAFDTLRDRRIELIHGELRTMTPPGPDHSNAVSWLTTWSVLSPPKHAVAVRVQDPVAIPALDSVPQPDIVWVRQQSYRLRHPTPDEILLLIEVSDSSLDYDCGDKAELYAAAGIQDYWVVNLQDRVIHVFRSPAGDCYRDKTTIKFGEVLRPLAFPSVQISVAELFSA